MLLSYVFFRRLCGPRARSWTLGLMLISSIFLWLFLGLSLAFCFGSSGAYESHEEATIAAVFGRALLFALVTGLPLAILLRSLSPRIVLAKMKELTLPSSKVRKDFAVLRLKIGVPAASVRVCKTQLPISFAIVAERPLVVVSESLISLLTRDELQAVMAHELAHIRNSDTALKAFVTAYKAALPHDPVIRLLEAAFHREREIVADDTAVAVTRKPLSLASALLKIYETFPKDNQGPYGVFSILGPRSSLFQHHPAVIPRVNRLVQQARIHKTKR